MQQLQLHIIYVHVNGLPVYTTSNAYKKATKNGKEYIWGQTWIDFE